MADKLDEPVVEETTKRGGMNPKIFLIGLPLFIVQLVIVYFVTANILMTKNDSNLTQNETESVSSVSSEEPDEETESGAVDTSQLGQHIYSIEDIIINPAGTGGQRIMLVSLGFDVASEAMVTALSDKNMVIKDMIITTLSSKTLEQLSDAQFKESLKSELIQNLTNTFPSIKVKTVYFSKYIIN